MIVISHVWDVARGLAALAAALILAMNAAGRVQADDGAPLERIATIQSKGKPGTLDHLFVDSESARLFLANQSNDTLDVMDLKSNQLLKQVPDQKTIHSVVFVPSLERIFVGSGDGVCNVLDARSYALLKSIPAIGADSVRYDSRSGHVFVASRKSLTIIDAKTLDVIATVKLPGSPHGLQVAKNRGRIYVNTGPPNQVAVIDTDKNELVASYSLAGESKGIGPLALDEANGRILVGLRAKPRLALLEIDSGRETATAPIPEGADDMYRDVEAKRVYISCNSGFVAVMRQLDSEHYESIANVPTVKGAKTSFYDPALKRLYVAVPLQVGKEGPEIWVYRARP